MYHSEIFEINKFLKYIDSTTSTYILKIEINKYVASTKGIDLHKKIEKENKLKEQIELAQLELERQNTIQKNEEQEYYNQDYYDPVNKSINYAQKFIAENRTSELLNRTYDIPQIIQTPNNIIYIPDNNINYSTNSNSNIEQVDGYIKSNGTYVEQYIRTSKNNTDIDNFSFYGNLNPNTRKTGTKR